jgi:hypothetical protein
VDEKFQRATKGRNCKNQRLQRMVEVLRRQEMAEKLRLWKTRGNEEPKAGAKARRTACHSQ